MTSRDPERSRSWPQYVWCPLSRKWLEIATLWRCIPYKKWHPGNRLVTWPMTSRDPERSRSWPQYAWCPLSRKRLEIATWWQNSHYRKWPPGNQMITWPFTWPLTSRDPERSRSWSRYMFGTHYVENGWRYRLGDNGAPIENGHLGIKWSRDRCRHVTLKCQDVDHNALRGQYLENGWRYRLCSKGS